MPQPPPVPWSVAVPFLSRSPLLKKMPYGRIGVSRVSARRVPIRTAAPAPIRAGLLVHGMLDDNVLFQDTARMAQALIDERKQFSMFGYPRDDHGIGKATSRPHVFGQIMRHLYWKLRE